MTGHDLKQLIYWCYISVERVGGVIIPEGALYVYEVSRLNYTYVWLSFLFRCFFFFFDCVSNWKCYIVEM